MITDNKNQVLFWGHNYTLINLGIYGLYSHVNNLRNHVNGRFCKKKNMFSKLDKFVKE